VLKYPIPIDEDESRRWDWELTGVEVGLGGDSLFLVYLELVFPSL
jgi:hypothetical protein